MKLWPIIATGLFGAMLSCQHDGRAAASLRSDADVSTRETVLPPYEPVNVRVEVDADKAKDGPAKDLKSDDGMRLAEASGDDDKYFMVVFGFQGREFFNLPRNAHSFAMFLRTSGSDLTAAPIQAFVISWLPVDGVVQFGQGLKPGRNYTFAESMNLVVRDNRDIRRTPIVRIQPTLFAKALERYNRLNAGSASQSILYRMIDDMNGRSMVMRGIAGGYTNCIHALTDILLVNDGSLLDTSIKHGFAASDAIFQFLGAYAMDNGAPYDAYLASRLGI